MNDINGDSMNIWGPSEANPRMHSVDICLVMLRAIAHWMMRLRPCMDLTQPWMNPTCSFTKKSWQPSPRPNFC